ncbi:ATP-grasp domain-containing protein [Aestuariispira insulae]|uniref:ATP-grasp domain-containing protein n=1 Tax=Aestuariispira insulae TaxID=1461337 RepID=A0A3D9HP86_9PROT|nr:ATP-grasp domain-containing protein [Aestuariispira insulae]RED51279.1 ATP-grasp domain-containing protein [Aestuariispira insulae]
MKTILIIGLNIAAGKYLPVQLKKMGYNSIILLDSNRDTCGSGDEIGLSECHIADIGDPVSVIDFLERHPDIVERADYVTSCYDDVFNLVAEVKERFNLSGPPTVFAKLSDKDFVARLVPEYSPQTTAINLSDPGLIHKLSHLDDSKAYILKLPISSGAVGNQFIDPVQGQSLIETVTKALNSSKIHEATRREWILQEAIPGRLFSFEGFVEGGKVTCLGVSKRGRLKFTEVRNSYPVDRQFSTSIHQQCRDCIQRLTWRAGFENGYFHCEFILNKDRAYLIDANMGRMCVGTFLEQAAEAHSLTAGEIAAHGLLLPLGEAVTRPCYRDPSDCPETLGIYYCLRSGGRVLGWDIPETFCNNHTKMVQPDSLVPPVGESNQAWVGMAVGQAKTLLSQMRNLRIQTEEELQAPVFL